VYLDEIICLIPQVVLYEDELADNGVSLLTVKVVNAKIFTNCSKH
jgi:hypothetical protein